ncbi:hypothetical protein ACFQ71_26075 [Streptomyces sp. NPDC056534]|uniref:hypothetical protein n=1 Tax=Streptomyces sp. NPDC056534 TaxID=3345857 RepID=UPI00367E4BFC
MMKPESVSQVSFGPPFLYQPPRVSQPSVESAYWCIGANTAAGFTVLRYGTDGEGRPLRTRDGQALLVVALVGGSGALLDVFAFVGEGGR